MNRLSWDTTAPRRLKRKVSAELIRGAWQKPERVNGF